jgi:hypothetical protein
MIGKYFNSEPERDSAFNTTNAVVGRFNRILSHYIYKRRRLSLSFLRDTNANMIMKRIKNVGVLMKLHGECSKAYINKYQLKDDEVASQYKKHIYVIRRKNERTT